MFTPSRFPRATAAARQVLSDFCLVKAADVRIEALAMGMKVFVKDDSLDGVAAILSWKGCSGIVTVDSNIVEPGRRRFAVAHELGHFRLHKEKNAFICTDDMFLPWYGSSELEPEANAFAAELLMPEAVVHSMMRSKLPTRDLIENACSFFETSLTATCFRYVEIECYPCVLFAVIDGKVKWMVKSTALSHCRAKGPGARLDDSSCAGDFFVNGNRESGDSQAVLASAWFDGLEECRMAYELPFYAPHFNMVISLVWLD